MLFSLSAISRCVCRSICRRLCRRFPRRTGIRLPFRNRLRGCLIWNQKQVTLTNRILTRTTLSRWVKDLVKRKLYLTTAIRVINFITSVTQFTTNDCRMVTTTAIQRMTATRTSTTCLIQKYWPFGMCIEMTFNCGIERRFIRWLECLFA